MEEPVDGEPLELLESGAMLQFTIQPFEIVTLRLRR